MRIAAVLVVTLLAGAAHAAGEGASRSVAAPAAASGVEMFSPEWRQQKIRDREANLQALDEEQRRFDKWERSARQAVGGICADCLGAGRGGHTVTIPGEAVASVPGPADGLVGFDEASSYYVVRPAAQAVAVAAPTPLPEAPLPAAPRAVTPAGSMAPLDIRTPAAR